MEISSSDRAELVAGIRKAVTEQQAELAQKVLNIEQRLAELPSHARAALSPGRLLASGISHPRVRLLQDGHASSGRFPVEGVRPSNLRALIGGTGTDSPSGTFPTQPLRGGVVEPVQRQLSLLDILPARPVTSSTFEYARLHRTRSAAAQTSEGAEKPETAFEASLITTPIATIATHTTASRQIIADAIGLDAALRNTLARDVADQVEYQIVRGSGASGQMEGLYTLATPLAVTAADVSEVLSEGAATMAASGYTPSAIILHPYNWHVLRTLRADSGSGLYLSGAWSAPSQPTAWGMAVIESASMVQGEALIVDTSRVSVLDREDVTVMISTEHSDNFTKNMVTILAEARVGFAVYDADAVRVVSIGNSP